MAKSSRTAPANSMVIEKTEHDAPKPKKGKETKVPPKADSKKGKAAADPKVVK